MGTAKLLAAWGGEPPVIAFYSEDDRQLPNCGYVERLVEVSLAGGAVTGEDQRGFTRVPEQRGERNSIGDSKLRAEVADHADNVVGHASEMKAPVMSLREAGSFALELGKQLSQFYAPRGEDSKVAVHGQDKFILSQGRSAANGNGLLSHSAEPLADSTLPEETEHLLLNKARQQELIEQLNHAIGIQTTVFDAQVGNVGMRHTSNLLPAKGVLA